MADFAIESFCMQRFSSWSHVIECFCVLCVSGVIALLIINMYLMSLQYIYFCIVLHGTVCPSVHGARCT